MPHSSSFQVYTFATHVLHKSLPFSIVPAPVCHCPIHTNQTSPSSPQLSFEFRDPLRVGISSPLYASAFSRSFASWWAHTALEFVLTNGSVNVKYCLWRSVTLWESVAYSERFLHTLYNIVSGDELTSSTEWFLLFTHLQCFGQRGGKDYGVVRAVRGDVQSLIPGQRHAIAPGIC